MTDEQILENIGLLDASEELKKASVEGIKQIADKRTMGILESLLDEDEIAEIERRTKNGSSLEHNIDWIQRTLAVDVQDIYDSALKDYVNELIRKTQ